MIDKSYYVYAHFSPLASCPFYIGKGKGYRATTRSGRLPEWHDAAKDGLEVVILKDKMPEQCAYSFERAVIEGMKVFDYLVNKTDGGGGSRNIKTHYLRGKSMPEAHRAAIRAKQSGRLHAQFDWKIYTFEHENHGQVKRLRSEMITEFGLSPPKVCNLISGKRKMHKGWRIVR